MPPAANPDPRPRPWGWRDGRWIILGLLVGQLTLFFEISPRLTVVEVAHRWGVFTIQPDFSDLYVIPAAGAARLAGEDPYRANPRDPLKRTFNYPPIWLYLWTTPPGPATIRLAAMAMGIFGTAGLLTYFGAIDRWRGAVLGALACSPAVVLAAQRANTDVLMLGLVAFALVLLRRGKDAAGYAALVAATWLKLFPIAALAVLLREQGNRLRRAGTVVLAAGALCFAVYAGYLGRIFANTPAGGLHSYGAPVLAFWLAFFLPAYGWTIDRVAAGHVCSLLALVVGLLAFRLSRGRQPLPLERVTASELDGLRVGAAIYVSTFLLGVSFDYRLLFLLLGVPALLSLAAAPAPGRNWGVVGLVLVFAVMWPNGLFWKPLLLVKEAGSWALFFALAVLLVRTLPAAWQARLRLA